MAESPIAVAATRLGRTNWSSPRMFAEELFTAITKQPSDDTGLVTVDLSAEAGDGRQFTAEPLPAIDLPAVDFETPNPQLLLVKPPIVSRRLELGQVEYTQAQEYVIRSAIPGRIAVKHADGTFDVDLYPEGTDDAPLRVTGAEAINPGAEVAVSFWAPVVHRQHRIRVSRVEVRQGGQNGPLITRRTELKLLKRRHLMGFTKPWEPKVGQDLGAPHPEPVTTEAPWGYPPWYDLGVGRPVAFQVILALTYYLPIEALVVNPATGQLETSYSYYSQTDTSYPQGIGWPVETVAYWPVINGPSLPTDYLGTTPTSPLTVIGFYLESGGTNGNVTMRLDSFNPGDGAITGVQASKPTTDWISGQPIEASLSSQAAREFRVGFASGFQLVSFPWQASVRCEFLGQQ